MSAKNHPDLIKQELVKHISKCRWCQIADDYKNPGYACKLGLGLFDFLQKAQNLSEGKEEITPEDLFLLN